MEAYSRKKIVVIASVGRILVSDMSPQGETLH